MISVDSQTVNQYRTSSLFPSPEEFASIDFVAEVSEKIEFSDRSRHNVASLRCDGVGKWARDIPIFFFQNFIFEFFISRLDLKFSALFLITTTACIADWIIDQTHNPKNNPRSPPTSAKRLLTEYVTLSSWRMFASSEIRITAAINSISSPCPVCFRICFW